MMSENMSMPCVDPSCTLKSVVYCYDCKKSYCQNHYVKHTGQLKVLEDELFAVADGFSDLQPKELFESLKARLDLARKDGHRMVDDFYDEKSRKMEDKIRSPGKRLRFAQAKLDRLKGKPQVTHDEMDELKENIKEARDEIRLINQWRENEALIIPKISFSEVSTTTIRKDTLPKLGPMKKISTNQAKTYRDDPLNFSYQNEPPIKSSLTAISPPDPPSARKVVKLSNREIEVKTPTRPVKTPKVNDGLFRFSLNYKTIKCSNRTGVSMSSNDEIFLVYENNSLIVFNENSEPIRNGSWSAGSIYEIVWAKSLRQFVIITEWGAVFLLDPNDLDSFERVDAIGEDNWWSAASTENFLYISTFGRAPSLFQFDVENDFQQIKEFRTPFLCQQDESIEQIRSNDERFVFLIVDPQKNNVRCDVRSTKTLQIIWSRPLTNPNRNQLTPIRCCFLPNNQILVVYQDHNKVFHIDQNGKVDVIDHKRPAWNALSFNDGKQIVVRTDKLLLVYQN